MNRHLHQITQSPFAKPASLFSAAVACVSLTIAGVGLVAAAPYHTQTAVSKSTTMTPQEAARFRARMNKIPHLNRLSTRNQVNAFVAYFAAKGFHKNTYAATYSPSGRVETLEYHASRGSRSTNKVDVSISKHKSLTTISMT